MEPKQGPKPNRWPRVVIPANTPVFLNAIAPSAPVNLIVEDLSVRGALLLCPSIAQPPDVGHRFFGELVLPDGRTFVEAEVRWRLWPKVGVQFVGVSPEAVEQISRLITSICANTT